MTAFLVSVLLLAQSPPQTESLPCDPADWKDVPRFEVRVKDGAATTVYRGVPLHTVLAGKAKGKDGGAMSELRSLADAVLLVRAEDDYQAAVSAAAVLMDPKGERYLLALERDGKPLADGQGPVKLVIPGDPQHVRWVRMVTSVELVRLPKPAAKEKGKAKRVPRESR